MSLDAMKQALEALEHVHRTGDTQVFDLCYADKVIPALRAAIEQAQGLAEKVPARGTLLEQTLRRVWDEMPHTDYQKEMEQEPVAWMHKHIENNVITHRPADLDRHPDRWVALYNTPPPCPTCEALARTVMMDQTSHDTAPRQWQGLTEEDVDEVERWIEFKEDGSGRIPNQKLVRYIERKLKEKNNG